MTTLATCLFVMLPFVTYNVTLFLCPAQISIKRGAINGKIPSQWYKTTLTQHDVLRQHLKRPYSFQEYSAEEKKKNEGGYDRVVTFRDWPWEDLQADQRKTGTTPPPFVVIGEVSVEKSYEYAAMPKISLRRGGCLPPEELHIQGLMETAKQFLEVALLELREHQPIPQTNRERYLVALPFLGTGGGFAGDLTGQIVNRLLQITSEFVSQRDTVDVVLVCVDEATYAHAQTIRQGIFRQEKADGEHNALALHQSFSIPCFQELTAELANYALQLANLASNQKLALFFGAGVSIGSGLPSWFGLLHIIEDCFTTNGLPEERRLGSETIWNPLEMAAKLDILCRTQPDRQGLLRSLKGRICAYIKTNAQRPGLLLSLLVSLPCDSLVTQNYDQLIEKACDCWCVPSKKSGRPVDGPLDGPPLPNKSLSVIPYKPLRKARHWLLKMHGCVSAPKEIVITQDDYDTYEVSRARALSGLVQASLMTKHLVFVGYSLSEPNYLRIIHEVRESLHPYSDDEDSSTSND